MAGKVTLKEIANHMGVSITTVSKALNGHQDISAKMREEIIAYANEVDYIPNLVARNFRQKRTNTIGVILNNYANPYNSRMMHGIEVFLTEHGYMPIFMDNHGDAQFERDLLVNLRAMNAAGILLTPALGSDKNIESLRNSKVPYVLVRETMGSAGTQDAYVTVDDEETGYLAAKYLTGFHNPKIFFLNGPEDNRSSRERMKGYRRAVEESGQEIDEDCVFRNCMDSTDGYLAMREILHNHKPPFSVVCYSDYIAAGAVTALQERQVNIPYEVPVIGADNIDILSYMKPRLTTLDYPKKMLGERAAEILVELIEKKEAAGSDNEDAAEQMDMTEYQVTFKPNLLIRETG